MGLATFKGGIHPYEGKELSENKPVQELLPKGELVFPMSQHIGAPAKPLVKRRPCAGRPDDRGGRRFYLRQCPFLRIRHGKGSGAKACGKRPDGDVA